MTVCRRGLRRRLAPVFSTPRVAALRSTGIPDMGLINPVQITERLEQIVDAVDLNEPDFDTGYGNALMRCTLKGFERAGVAGFRIESGFPNGAAISTARPSCRRKNWQPD